MAKPELEGAFADFKEREALADCKRVAGWLASRTVAASSQPAASDRVEALRKRIMAKSAMGAVPSLSAMRARITSG